MLNLHQKRNKLFQLFTKRMTWLLLLFGVVLIAPVSAQNPLVNQTIEKAKVLRNEKKFGEAARLLSDFEKKYPGNLWIEQLYAQTLFWLKDYRTADLVYRRAIGYHPANPDLRYGYAEMLFAENKLDEAVQQLQVYVDLKPQDAAGQAFLGKVFYYLQQFRKAEKHLALAVGQNPSDKETESLYREVYRIVSPQLSFAAVYMNDDQPLQSFGTQVKFQWFVSNALDLDVSGTGFRYFDISDPGIISKIEAGNRFHFAKAHLTFRLAGAWFYADALQTQDWGGSVELEKKLGKVVRVSLEAGRTNYTYTVASVENNLLMVNQYALHLAVGKSNGWNGEAGGRYQFFPDDNYVSAFYGWFLSRPVKLSGFRLAFGYAFNYMDSKEDRFEPKPGNRFQGAAGNVEGVYVPYYTPHNQYANSLLANFNYRFSSYAALYGHASVGVYSQTYAPGYTLSNTGNYEKTFSYQSYTPLDLGLRFQADISRKAKFSLDYTFLQTYYYSSHNVRLAFSYYF